MYLYLFAQLIHESQSETGQTTCENVCMYAYICICIDTDTVSADLLWILGACGLVASCLVTSSRHVLHRYLVNMHTHTPWFLASDFLTKIKPPYAHAGSDERQQSKERRKTTTNRNTNNTNKCKWKCMSHSRRMHFISFYFVYLHCK